MDLVQAWIERVLGYQVAWDDTASWVQAFGSTAGILWGVLLYWRGEEERKKLRAEHRANVGRVCAAAVRFSAAQLYAINQIVSDPTTLLNKISPVTFDRLSMADEMLRSIPVLEAESASVIDALVATRSRVAQARRRCDEYNENIRKSQVGTVALLSDIRRQLNVLWNKLHADSAALSARYGFSPDDNGAEPLAGNQA